MLTGVLRPQRNGRLPRSQKQRLSLKDTKLAEHDVADGPPGADGTSSPDDKLAEYFKDEFGAAAVPFQLEAIR